MDEIKNMAKKFDNLIGNVVGEVKNGIDLFDSVINSDINIGDIAKAFVDALEQLPNKVRGICTVNYKKLYRCNC